MAKQPPQESHLPEHDATKLELVVTINETDNGTALDSQLRREQAEAFVGTHRRPSVAGSKRSPTL